jgi:hypothetical protein
MVIMEIIIERGKVSLLEELPNYSIALDGRVQGPAIDSDNNRYSFDHHSNCLRFCTTAACMQTRDAILLGLEPHKYTIYINDVDMDVCMAIWCLKNPDKCSDPRIKQLIDAVGQSDMHAGAFSLNGMTKTVEWVSAPQTDSIRNGDYTKLSDSGLLTIMESILHRIDQYLNGEAASEIANQGLHGEYSIKRNDNSWVLVESLDPHVYSALYRAGFDRIVLIKPQDNGTNVVSLAKRSDFIEEFPLEGIYKALDKLEPTWGGKTGWGGSSSIGGSPRNEDGSGTSLPVEVVTKVVDLLVKGEEVPFKELQALAPAKKKKRTTKKTTRRKTIPPKD